MLFHRMALGELGANCYITADEETGRACIFDAPDDAERILAYMDKKGLKLGYIFLTHAHFDHIMALDELKRATGAKVYIHPDDVEMLNNPALNLSADCNVTLPRLEYDAAVLDGDVIETPCGEVRVIHTPGHTKGSVCYLLNGDTLISGDTLFKRSIGRSDGPGGSYENEISAIKEKLMTLDDDVKVYPGHGFSTSIGAERKENPFLI